MACHAPPVSATKDLLTSPAAAADIAQSTAVSQRDVPHKQIGDRCESPHLGASLHKPAMRRGVFDQLRLVQSSDTRSPKQPEQRTAMRQPATTRNQHQPTTKRPTAPRCDAKQQRAIGPAAPSNGKAPLAKQQVMHSMEDQYRQMMQRVGREDRAVALVDSFVAIFTRLAPYPYTLKHLDQLLDAAQCSSERDCAKEVQQSKSNTFCFRQRVQAAIAFLVV